MMSNNQEPEGPTTNALKLSNKKSRFNKPASNKQDFEERADQYMGERQDRNKRGLELVKQFLSIINSHEIIENKSILVKDVEKDAVTKLVNLAIEINNDENEPNEAMGSITLIQLLLKVILLQRDDINTLRYNMHQSDKRISELEKNLSSRYAKTD